MTRRAGDRYAALIPGFAVRGPALEYYVEVFDRQGNGPAYAGEPERPRRVPIVDRAAPPLAATAGTPWYRRWWVWSAVATAVVGAVVTGVAVGVAGDEAPRELRINAPAPRSPVLER